MMTGCPVGQGNELHGGVQFLAVAGKEAAGMVFGVVGMGSKEEYARRSGHFDRNRFYLAACGVAKRLSLLIVPLSDSFANLKN